MVNEKEVFSEEELHNMDEIFAERTKFFKENSEARKQFTNIKGKYDALSLDNKNNHYKFTHSEISQDFNFSYDIKSDLAYFYDEDDDNQRYKVELDDSTFLYFNEDFNPVSLKIINASKKFNLKKHNIKNLDDFNMHIKVTPKKIEVKMHFQFIIHNKETSFKLSPKVANYLDIPSNEKEVVVTP